MSENEPNKMPDSLPSCSSAAEERKPEDKREPEDDDESEESSLQLFEAAYMSILEELVDDAMWELCFEVHRAAKLGYALPIEEPKPVEDDEKDIFGQELDSKVEDFEITCPVCDSKTSGTKFASHLAKCIGKGDKNSSKAPSKKTASSNVPIGKDTDQNDDCDSDSSYNAHTKRSKKSQAKKTSQMKAKEQGDQSSKSVT